MDQEIWKDIEGFEGYYQVSNTKQVRSINRTIWSEKRQAYINRKGVILKQYTDSQGYNNVILHKEGKYYTFKVARLVCIAFNPNTDNKPLVDHINRIRTDNVPENLRWVTPKENANNRKDNIPSEILEEYKKSWRQKYYAENKEIFAERTKKWRAENKERLRELKHRYYMRHRTSTMDHNNLKTKDPDYYKKYYAAKKNKN